MLQTSKGTVSLLPVDYLIWNRCWPSLLRMPVAIAAAKDLRILDYGQGEPSCNGQTKGARLEGDAEGGCPVWPMTVQIRLHGLSMRRRTEGSSSADIEPCPMPWSLRRSRQREERQEWHRARRGYLSGGCAGGGKGSE